MRPRGLSLALAIALSLTVFLIGCGGNASPAPTTTGRPTPTTPATPAPTPTPSPTPAPSPSGGGGGTSGTPQWQVALHGINGNNGGLSGTATVTTSGDVTLQFTGATPSTTFTLAFCPVSIVSNSVPCVSLPTAMSDASGAGQVSFHFPQSGTWAGYFSGRTSNASVAGFGSVAETAGAYNSPVQQIVPATKANGVGIDGGHPQDPGSGTISVTNGLVHVALTGAVPNKAYNVFSCYSGSSSCQSAGRITTDASGNATADLKLSSNGVGIVAIGETTGSVMFAGGFKAP